MECPRRRMGRASKVRVGLQGNRPICDPHYARFKQGEPLKWHVDGAWAVHFLDRRTPIPGVFDIRGNGPEVHGTNNAATEEGHYRYAIAVMPSNQPGSIFIDATCPEIIIG